MENRRCSPAVQASWTKANCDLVLSLVRCLLAQHCKGSDESQDAGHLVDSSHFAAEEAEAERGSKSSLWISKWFIWERAAVSSHPIVKAHIQVQQTASDITYASELLHFRVLLKFCTFTVHTWYSASGKKKLIWSYLLETKNGTDTPFNQKKKPKNKQKP